MENFTDALQNCAGTRSNKQGVLDPDAGKGKGWRRRGVTGMGWLEGTINSVDMSLSKLREIKKGSEAWYAAVHGVTKSWT